jgi:hypothetical protein
MRVAPPIGNLRSAPAILSPAYWLEVVVVKPKAAI